MATEETYWLVTGRYLPSDAEDDPAGQEQSAEEVVTTQVFESEERAQVGSLFYASDVKITHVRIHRSEDSGGSSYLCCCSGIDTGRHVDDPGWRCPYLDEFEEIND